MKEEELARLLQLNEEAKVWYFQNYHGPTVITGLNTPIAPPIPRKADSSEKKAKKRKFLYEKQKGYCAYCDQLFSPDKLTFDHIKPKSKGGGKNYQNLVLVCHRCNSLKGDLASWAEVEERLHIFVSFVNTLRAKGYLK